MKYMYTAIISPMDDGNGYCVNVPDLPGCTTSGQTIMDAMEQITDAMGGYLCVQEDEHLPIPPATSPENVVHGEKDVCYLVAVDTLRVRMETDSRAVRKNVSLPAWLARMADEKHVNCSQVLQEALKVKLDII